MSLDVVYTSLRWHSLLSVGHPFPEEGFLGSAFHLILPGCQEVLATMGSTYQKLRPGSALSAWGSHACSLASTKITEPLLCLTRGLLF